MIGLLESEPFKIIVVLKKDLEFQEEYRYE
jgi:hypothetical protein